MRSTATGINALYGYAQSQAVEFAVAKAPDVTAYCSALHHVRKVLNVNADDRALLELNGLASRFRFRMLSAPLPLNHSALIDRDEEARLKKRLQDLPNQYGELKGASEQMLTAFARLRQNGGTPLWDAVEPFLRDETGGVGFVIRPPQLAGPTQEFCGSIMKGLRVITEHQLRGSETYDELYFFGAMRWFSGFVLSAPRAPRAVFARYSVLRDGPMDRPKFLQTLNLVRAEPLIVDAAVDDFAMRAEEVVPASSVETLVRRVTSSFSRYAEEERADTIEARVLLLEHGLAVLAPATDSSKELVIDFEGDQAQPVNRVRTLSLQAGMAVIVRTEGGGGYVVPAANQILGERAEELRATQVMWKRSLLDVVLAQGYYGVLGKLRAAGGRLVNEQNLRNWTSTRWIRTQYREDFEAIFTVIDKSAQVGRAWEQMGEIQAAHQSAGSAIRRRLLEQVRAADMSYLQRDGRMDFTLPGELGGGKITAIRIIGIAPEVVRAPWSAVHRLISVGD